MHTGEILIGYAAMFDKLSQPINNTFVEIIRRGAFAHTIAHDDIRSLINHNHDLLIGRNINGTLTLEEDAVGLKIAIHPPDTSVGRDITESIRRGDTTGMSFAFAVRPGGDRWLRAPKGSLFPIRELLDVQIFEVSPVTWPAYLSSSISVAPGSTVKRSLPPIPARPMPSLDIRRKRLHLAELCA